MGHFCVVYPEEGRREIEEIEEIVEEMRGHGRKRKMNESEGTEEVVASWYLSRNPNS